MWYVTVQRPETSAAALRFMCCTLLPGRGGGGGGGGGGGRGPAGRGGALFYPPPPPPPPTAPFGQYGRSELCTARMQSQAAPAGTQQPQAPSEAPSNP